MQLRVKYAEFLGSPQVLLYLLELYFIIEHI